MHEVIAKIARFGVSKAAAFCYAVTVGVSGNMAFNYMQPRDPAPAIAPAISPAIVPAVAAAPVPAPVPAEPAGPAPPKPVATAPIFPEPSAFALPSLAALPAPVLKPTALPTAPHAVRPSEAAVVPALAAHPGPSPAPGPGDPGRLIGEDAAEAPSRARTPGGPIPLLPSAASAEMLPPENSMPATSPRPGPGSGGLY